MNASLTNDLSVVSLLVNASVLVQLVMGALLLASLFSWYYIFLKRFVLRRAANLADEFEKQFWSGAELAALYRRANAARHPGTLERLTSDDQAHRTAGHGRGGGHGWHSPRDARDIPARDGTP